VEWIRKTWNLILPRDDYQAEKVRAIAVTVGGGAPERVPMFL